LHYLLDNVGLNGYSLTYVRTKEVAKTTRKTINQPTIGGMWIQFK